jgi:glutamyl-tRNA reductase
MHIIALGLNHTTAPIQLRERLVYSEDQIRASLARFSCGKLSSPFSEMVILSTCNRTEIYSTSSELSFDMLEVFLSETSDVPIYEILPHLYRFDDVDAVQHLFEVAAGLDSLVVGEPQILGQVTKALELARGQDAVGPVLNRLFQSAIHAGKRARTETAISRQPASVSSLAASKAEKAVRSISAAQVVILGAGEMAELAVEALRKRGANRILVVNRTLERTQPLVQRWDAQATTFENINSALVAADVLIASTGAPHTIITCGMVKDAMSQRKDRPLVLIDIAVPRDIDPDVTDIPNVRSYDMDSLNDNLEQSLAKRKAEVPQVKIIVDEEVLVFEEYMRSLEMIPIIADMRQQAETIRQTVLKKSLNKLPDITDLERERIDAMTQALVKKILDAPTNRLRVEALSPRASEYAQITRSLFNISDERTYPTSTAAD